MAGGQLTTLIQFLRTLAARAAADATDRELLQRFTAEREEAAFAAMLQRHGPMVLSVCQRVLHDPHDAEDAFQATFLVFVRKAHTLGRPERLGNWLYGVAYRTALKARAESAKRRKHERPIVDVPAAETLSHAESADLRRLVDEEVNRLPAKYRAPFVLCYLEGRTNEEAARVLGCPKGTVLSRLAWARQRLRGRLTRRGVMVSAALFAAAMSQNGAPASLPAVLVGSTIRAATLFAAGRATTGEAISSQVAALAEGVLKTMFVARAKMIITLLAGVTFLAAGAGVILGYAQATKQPEARPQPAFNLGQGRVAFQRSPLDADDIIAVTGLNIYKFNLDIPKGQRFELRFSELPAKDAPTKGERRFIFQKVKDGLLTLRVSFLRRDRQLHGVLLSQEKDAEFDVACEGCSPSGTGTIVPMPLLDVPPTQKSLVVVRSDKGWGAAKDGHPTRLLAVFESKKQPVEGPFDSIYPRAELIIIIPPEP
jgi:RNA polymerase sigma factor (sigma-70 family)